MNEDKFKKIDDLNTTLENVYNLANNTLTNFDIEGMTQEGAQMLVDDLCIRISNSINDKLEKQRIELINVLHQGFISSNEIIEQLKPLVEFNLNIDTVVDAVRQIITILSGPYQKAVEYTTELAPKLLTLTDNIAGLALLKDKLPQHPSMPILNYNKLNITMKPITIQEVINGMPSDN